MAASQHKPAFIREWRKHRGLHAKALAALTGIPPSTISRLENGRTPYTQEHLEAIAAALHCDPVDLIGRPPSLARRDELVSLVDGLPTEKRHEALSILRILAGAVPAE